jgi:hypothetical protein
MTGRKKLLRSATPGVVAAVLVTGIAWATIPGTGGVIQGCYGKTGGIVRIVDKASQCLPNLEVAITWNQAGSKGDPGIAGPKGNTGVAGAQGATGALGPTGPAGGAGPKGDTGAAGQQGSTGAVGAAGATGAAGPTGDSGPSGPTGDSGPSGPTGPAGSGGEGSPCAVPGQWFGSADGLIKFTVQPSAIVSVTCLAPKLTLTVQGSAGGSGSVSIITIVSTDVGCDGVGTTNTCASFVTAGSTIQILAEKERTIDEGDPLVLPVTWSGCDSVSAGICTFVMPAGEASLSVH